jgi:hypothetical protein
MEARTRLTRRETTPVLKFTATHTPVPDIEQAVGEVLSAYPGSWTVHIDQGLAGGWWAMTVSTEGFHRTFLLAPAEHSAQEIARQLAEALKRPSGRRS